MCLKSNLKYIKQGSRTISQMKLNWTFLGFARKFLQNSSPHIPYSRQFFIKPIVIFYILHSAKMRAKKFNISYSYG